MANVRIFGYASIVQIEQTGIKSFTSDSVFVRQEPYLWASGALALNGLTPIVMAPVPNDQANIIVVEVDDNTKIRYEINPPGYSRAASASSPILDGVNVFQWFKGGSIQFIDANGT